LSLFSTITNSNDYETSKGDRQTHRPHLLSSNHSEWTTAKCQQVPAV